MLFDLLQRLSGNDLGSLICFNYQYSVPNPARTARLEAVAEADAKLA